MQIIRTFERSDATLVGWGVRVLLLSTEGEQGPIARRLASLGGKVDVADELFAALSEVIDDPAGYGLFVVDCDSYGVGGLEAAQRAVQMLGDATQRVPVILVSHECREQLFPAERNQPTVLRAPLSAVSLKVGYEHALRDRMLYRAA
jgi:hypothetical protein